MVDETSPLLELSDRKPTQQIPLDDIYNDKPQDMTVGRRLARFLSQFSWYNPHVKQYAAASSASSIDKETPQPPSLDRGWAYFEHVTLPRHFVEPSSERDVFKRAETGEYEEPTRLYSVTETPESDLADFGIGVGMYFFTLRALAIVMLIAGIINIPNMIYFAGERFSSVDSGMFLWSLQASAICTDTKWVPCPTCTLSDWERFSETDRYAETKDGLSFLKINNCTIEQWNLKIAYACFIFVCVAVYLISRYACRKEQEFDFASQTASDYAIEVTNPPKDARDAEEWREFFSQFGHVTSITVALDNEELLAALVDRRFLTAALQNLQPPNVTVDPRDIDKAVETASNVPWYLRLVYSASRTIRKKIHKIDEIVNADLSQREYDVSNVFCIFETEESQQAALKTLSVRGLDILRNNTSVLADTYLFRGRHLLSVKEPPEPSSIRWKDLDENVVVRFQWRFVMFLMTVAFILMSCLLVDYIRFHYGPIYAALSITAINSIAPAVCRFLTSFESHPSEGSMHASVYCKTTACLWILSAIITSYVTAFVNTLNNDRESLIPAIYAVFITEMFKTPVTQALDIPGNFQRHILAPRMPDQRRMNACFIGAFYEISERYTVMTNVLFMNFYYAAIFPSGFFFAAATLGVHYWVDKFCLLRSWARAPMVGSQVAEMNRRYFLSAALVVYALMSSYNFASFPFDNACELDTTIASEYVGFFNATDGEGSPVSFTIEEGGRNYKFCNQDMLRYRIPAFPAVPSNQPRGNEWMRPEQSFTRVFGWTSVWVILFVVGIFLNEFRKNVKHLLWSRYEPHSWAQQTNQRFSEVKDIYAYIPQVLIPGELFPTIVCDVSLIDHQELVDWSDYADPSKDSHNAIHDIPGLAKKDVFSIVRHWKP